MGQKINPISFRLPITKQWKSNWYASRSTYTKNLLEDIRMRQIIEDKLKGEAGIERIKINRANNEIKINVLSSRPGVIIGRQGQGIQDLRKWLTQKLALQGKIKLDLEVTELKNPDLSARIVAQNVGYQISKRVHYKKAMKQAITKTMSAGARGVKIQASGRLGGIEIARTEKFSSGNLPTSTLREDIDFAMYHSQTNSGTVGIKVWIYKGPLKIERE